MSTAAPPSSAAAGQRQNRITRHRFADRLGHWLMAACVLILLFTAFAPILGAEFAWVAIHWMTGIVLCVLVVVHIVTAVVLGRLSRMLIGPRDLRDGLAVLRFNLRSTQDAPPLPGKYSLAQKGIHATFAVVVLTALVTGLLMLAKIDSPFWERNPYFLSDATWGVIYLLHGFSALTLITLVMLHVYFALRPEKRLYLRSMFVGTLTREEYETHHDTRRWRTGEDT